MLKLVFIRRAFPALSRPSLATSVPKKRKLSATYTPFAVKNTYTATFCCLDENSELSPNAKELYALSCNGLGKNATRLIRMATMTMSRLSWKKFFQG